MTTSIERRQLDTAFCKKLLDSFSPTTLTSPPRPLTWRGRFELSEAEHVYMRGVAVIVTVIDADLDYVYGAGACRASVKTLRSDVRAICLSLLLLKVPLLLFK